jgi:hypothetical protein
MICPKCRKLVLDNALFCGNCGLQLQTSGASTKPDPAVAAPDPVALAAGGAASWASTTPRLPGLIDRVKRVLFNPKDEWPIIASEPTSVGQLYTGYVMPLAGLAAVMSFVRMSLIGVSLPFGGAIRAPLAVGLTYALVTFGFGLLGLFLVGLIINALAPTFSGERSQRQALKTAAYAFTPAWLGTALGLLPTFATLLELVAGFYGIYLLYLGLPPLMRSPKEKSFGFTVTVVICTLLLGLLLGALSAATGALGHLAGGFGGLAGSQSNAAMRDQGAAAVGNVIGGMLGTDSQGNAQLGAALANLAKAGQQIDPQQVGAGNPNSGRDPSASRQSSAQAASVAAGGDSTPSAVSAATGVLTALGGALGGSHRVDPVGFQNLKSMLPTSLPGMQRTQAQGSDQQALGVKSSSASGDYQDAAGARVQIKIADMSGVSGLMDLAGALDQTTNSESDAGYEKDTTIGGRAVHEKYDRKARHGELSAIIAKRFELDVTGDAVDMSTLEQDLSAVDLARLEAMKDAGAQAR